MEADLQNFLDGLEADRFGIVPRIAGIGAPIAIEQTEKISEGRILGQVSSKDPFNSCQVADKVLRASWLG